MCDMWLLLLLLLLILRHEPYNLKVDVYSFAMIIFQLFETTTPFHGHDPVDAARQAAMLGARPGFPPRRNLTPMTQVGWGGVGVLWLAAVDGAGITAVAEWMVSAVQLPACSELIRAV